MWKTQLHIRKWQDSGPSPAETTFCREPGCRCGSAESVAACKEGDCFQPDEFYNAIASPTLGVDVFQKAYGFDDTFAFLDSDIDSGVIDKLNYLSDFMLENGYISKAIDVDSFVDTSYYEKLKTSE